MARAVYDRSCPDHPDSLCIINTEGRHITRAVADLKADAQDDRDAWLNETVLEAGQILVDGDTITIRWG